MTLSGCASYLEVRSLATGRADQPAYELSGSEPAALHQEASRLCPQGADILRQAVQAQRPQVDGSMSQRLGLPAEWLEPPRRTAQLVVLCHASPSGLLASAAHPPASAASAGAVERPAAAPIGPISVEW
ncbi:MAG: hypothetical protein JNL87_22975 [Burkholderiaceae bacterium]|nr:hypothetical protein [Burkholderiaceae bacterium]